MYQYGDKLAKVPISRYINWARYKIIPISR